ncbi:Gfo/Idh/MocA family oxidoreductase [Chloroflexota bacterium]
MNNIPSPQNFAAIGVAGYVAPRHLKAIRDTGNRLVAAVDPFDSVGVLDQFSYQVRFFTEIERFDRHLEKLRRGPAKKHIHYVSIMSPNYLHDAHCRLALRVGAQAICEKPLVINPWNLNQLAAIEAEHPGKIHTILQLRTHPALLDLKQSIDRDNKDRQYDVNLTYITSRGPWYHTSWKGSPEKSGGIATNIGIHFFDLLGWLFGPPGDVKVFLSQPKRMSGFIEFERARVKWFLSVDQADLPVTPAPGQNSTFRSITVDGQEIEFSGGFTDLHTRVYEETLAGRGFGIEESRPSIDLTYRIRQTPISPRDNRAHPFLFR